MKLSDLKSNSAYIQEPHWIDDIPGVEDLRLNVRGLGCGAYREAERKKIRDLPKADAARGVSLAISDRIQGECLAETVLVGWENLSDETGEPIPYSLETATKLLTDPDYEAFQAAVLTAAGRVNQQAKEA